MVLIKLLVFVLGIDLILFGFESELDIDLPFYVYLGVGFSSVVLL